MWMVRPRFISIAGLCLGVICIGCESNQDILPKDSRILLQESEFEFYSLPESPTIISLASLVKYSYEGLRIEILDQPVNGHTSKVGPSFLKYTPDPSFVEGEDVIKVGFISDSGEMLAKKEITIHVIPRANLFPCGVIAVGDAIMVGPGVERALSPISNDVVCNQSIEWSVVLAPIHGEVTVSGDSIRYYPTPGFEGPDRLIYRLRSASDTSSASFGYVDFLVTPCDA